MIKKLILFIFLFFPFILFAEYRAYQLEIYDKITNNQYVTITGFPPATFRTTHGGDHRIAYLLKATWKCHQDTSYYKKVCPMPQAIRPKFKIGDKVQINLNKHVTDQWEGIVEVMLWREDLRSNVYGIRFKEFQNSYTRFYEANLKLKN